MGGSQHYLFGHGTFRQRRTSTTRCFDQGEKHLGETFKTATSFSKVQEPKSCQRWTRNLGLEVQFVVKVSIALNHPKPLPVLGARTLSFRAALSKDCRPSTDHEPRQLGSVCKTPLMRHGSPNLCKSQGANNLVKHKQKNVAKGLVLSVFSFHCVVKMSYLFYPILNFEVPQVCGKRVRLLCVSGWQHSTEPSILTSVPKLVGSLKDHGLSCMGHTGYNGLFKQPRLWEKNKRSFQKLPCGQLFSNKTLSVYNLSKVSK